jgi:hypothetical protein
MTTEEARTYVLRAVKAGPRTASELLELARLTGDLDQRTYRAIDRALQHHRKAGRITFQNHLWVMLVPEVETWE